MKHPLILFDLDGTLVDTLRDIADSANAVLTDLGFPTHPTDAYRLMVGDGNRCLMQRALPADAQHLLDSALTAQLARYHEHMLDHSRPYPGIEELLQTLAAQSRALAVLSNKPDTLTRQVVTHLFPAGLFAVVRGQRDDTPLKPDPTAALAIAAELGHTPDQTAYVGDTAVDMQTGRSAGMFTLGVTWGFRDRQELLDHGAQAIIDHPSELPRLL